MAPPPHPPEPRLIPARAGKTARAACGTRAFRAHPRACGENPGDRTEAATLEGSSPRVRGKRAVDRAPHGPPGLIPARAGKTREAAALIAGSPAHPRACGENFAPPQRHSGSQGSSPRVRGKRKLVVSALADRRLIPARAGKTPACPPGEPGRGAHPRACGENEVAGRGGEVPCGSSPRVRGKPGHLVAGQRSERLIPARAGKTRTPAAPPRHGWAHPRACGENPREEPPPRLSEGSSPRVRGKLDAPSTRRTAARLIPARAGKTVRSTIPGASHAAHPRACGENPSGRTGIPGRTGSSPRVRGKQARREPEVLHRRLIPARAGKTFGSHGEGNWRPAHPRACGEN